MSITYRADWVLTGEGEPVRDGVVKVNHGRVVSVKPWQTGMRVDVDLGTSLITPGFTNAHTHLDLGALRGKLPPPKQFTDWLRQVIDYRRQGNVAEWDRAIEAGIAESLRQGTTWLSDISVGGRSEPFLAQSPLASEICLELIGMSDARIATTLQEALRWLQVAHDGPVRTVSPHAPYTVAYQLLVGLRLMHHHASPVMHVAETQAELELLENDSGPFVPFLQELGAWHPDNLVGSIDELLELLDEFYEVTLIHCNYLTREQWQRLSDDTTVVYCPRTHAYFGHEPHPYLQMIKDGIRVALGTDSLASNPDLSILNECRFLWQRDRQHLDGPTLMKLATGQRSAIEVKQPANWVVVPHDGSDSDPWDLLWRGVGPPSAVYLNGVAVPM